NSVLRSIERIGSSPESSSTVMMQIESDVSPCPARKMRPKMVENQVASSDMIQSIMAKLMLSEYTTMPSPLTFSRMRCQSRARGFSSRWIDQRRSVAENHHQMMKYSAQRMTKNGSFS